MWQKTQVAISVVQCPLYYSAVLLGILSNKDAMAYS